jgi:hypothetical protein
MLGFEADSVTVSVGFRGPFDGTDQGWLFRLGNEPSGSGNMLASHRRPLKEYASLADRYRRIGLKVG